MAKAKYEEWLKPENLTLLEGWRRDGLTYAQIAGNMGINVGTLHKYIKEHDEIADALKKGNDVCVYEVENALFKSAMGYDVEEIEITETKIVDKDGNLVDGTKRVTMHKRKRHVPAQPACQMFLLKNKRPAVWKDKPEPVINEDIGNDGFLEALKGTAAEDWEDLEDGNSPE